MFAAALSLLPSLGLLLLAALLSVALLPLIVATATVVVIAAAAISICEKRKHNVPECFVLPFDFVTVLHRFQVFLLKKVMGTKLSPSIHFCFDFLCWQILLPTTMPLFYWTWLAALLWEDELAPMNAMSLFMSMHFNSLSS